MSRCISLLVLPIVLLLGCGTNASQQSAEQSGAEAIGELQFPGLSSGAAEWLVENRNIIAVGIDTPSIDYGQSQLFETHQVLAGDNISVLENVANLEQLPEEGGVVVALPMKIEGGSGGPVRIVAFVP